MERGRRFPAVFLLAAFSASVLSLWSHDLANHDGGDGGCSAGICHYCTDAAHHRHDPCAFCSLRTLGQTADPLEAPASLMQEEPFAGFAVGTPLPVSFLSVPDSRGPPLF